MASDELTHASDRESVRSCVEQRCLLVPKQATALLADNDQLAARLEAVTAALDALVFALDHQPWMKVIAAKVAAKELFAAGQPASVHAQMVQANNEMVAEIDAALEAVGQPAPVEVGSPCDVCGQQIESHERTVLSEDGEGHQFRTHERCVPDLDRDCTKCNALWPPASATARDDRED